MTTSNCNLVTEKREVNENEPFVISHKNSFNHNSIVSVLYTIRIAVQNLLEKRKVRNVFSVHICTERPNLTRQTSRLDAKSLLFDFLVRPLVHACALLSTFGLLWYI